MSLKLWEPAVPYNDSRLASKTYILTSGNQQVLAVVTSGSQVGNRELWEPAVPCHEPNANIPVPVH